MEDDIALGLELVQVASGQVDGYEVEVVPAASALKVAQLLAPGVVAVEAVDAHDFAAIFHEGLGQNAIR
jgi:hypothetical protein